MYFCSFLDILHDNSGDWVPADNLETSDVLDSGADIVRGGDWVPADDEGTGDVSDSEADIVQGDWVPADLLDSRQYVERENWETAAADDALWFDAPEDFQPTATQSTCYVSKRSNKLVQTKTFPSQREIILRRKLHAARVSRDRYKKTVCMLKRKCKILQSKCSAKAVKMSGLESVVDCVSKYFTGDSLKFFISQLRLSACRPKGRRYSVDIKLLALSLHNFGARSYRFLSRIIALPSKTSLCLWLHSLSCEPGFTGEIFMALQHKLKAFSDRDKVCALMIDEMSLNCSS